MWRRTWGDTTLHANPRLRDRGYRPPDDVRHTEPGHSLTTGAAEYRIPRIMVEAMFGDQGSEGLSEIGRDWHNTFPAPLAAQKHLGPGPVELDIVDIDARCFGYPGAGATEKQQQGSIAAAPYGPLIRRRDERIQLRAGRRSAGTRVPSAPCA